MYKERVDDALVEEHEAVASASAEDAASFGVLVEHYQEIAFLAAYLIVRDDAAAEDVAQEASRHPLCRGRLRSPPDTLTASTPAPGAFERTKYP